MSTPSSAHKTLDLQDEVTGEPLAEKPVNVMVADSFEEEVRIESEPPEREDESVQAKKPTGLKQKMTEFFQHEPTWYLEHCLFEIISLVVFLVAFTFFFKGKDQNQ